MKKLRVLDLFSGIGGFSLGLERTGGFETVAFCEIAPFCQKVLKKHWPDVPIFNDVRNLDYDGAVDVICGGYPCQPFSTAGKRQGEADDRFLWYSMLGLIKEYRPAWVIGENVNGHISMGLDTVLSDLEGANYSWRPFVIPAIAVDAKHKRERVWTVAYSKSAGERGEIGNVREEERRSGEALLRKSDRPSESGSNANGVWKLQPEGGKQDLGRWIRNGDKEARWREWEPEPGMARMVNGLPDRLDRASALGNAVVPQIPEMIGYAILEAMKS